MVIRLLPVRQPPETEEAENGCWILDVGSRVREFREISSPAERRQLLDCMFAVSAADDSISSAEESQIRQIASELGFTHREFVTARLAYSDQREVMRAFRENR